MINENKKEKDKRVCQRKIMLTKSILVNQTLSVI